MVAFSALFYLPKIYFQKLNLSHQTSTYKRIELQSHANRRYFSHILMGRLERNDRVARAASKKLRLIYERKTKSWL